MIKELLFGSFLRRLGRVQLGLMMIMMSYASFAQTQISGTVVSDLGEGLPGATILAQGTSAGTVTDFDGNFSLVVPEGATNLVVSFIGYSTQTVGINGRSSIDVTLQPDAETLTEVVIVGYGTQKKTDVTGAITGVDSEEITGRGVTNPIQALQGAVPGIQVTNSTGRVGDSFNVVVRGQGSFSDDATPLYVVDGVIVDNIDFLNPQDIAKLDVLKDASSAAIYGSRAANGVVMIKTKGGSSIPRGTTVSFDAFYGFKNPARLPEMMSYSDWNDYHLSAYMATTSGYDDLTPEEYYDKVYPTSSNSVLRERVQNLDGYDWYDAVLQPGMQSNNYVSIAHRNGGSSYTIGAGYQKETGNIEKEGLEKFTLRSNIDQEINDKFKVGAAFTVAKSETQRGSRYAMQEAFRLNPFLHPYAVDAALNETDELFPNPGKLTDVDGNYLINKTSTYNPLLEIANSSDLQSQWNTIGNMYLQYKPVEWLMLKSTFSGGLKSYRRGKYSGVLTNDGAGNNNLASSEVENYQNFNYTWDNQVNFNKQINKHSINLMGLQSIFVTQTEESFMSSNNQPFETEFYNVGSGLQSSYNLGNEFRKSQLSSYALRLNYAFDEKYLVTLTNRWDGSSLLAEGKQWQSFPSVAVAWRLSNEAFLSGVSAVNDLKLRVGYGTTGNNNINPYATVNTLTQQTYYDYNGGSANGWVANSIANKALTWERMKELNIGLDFAFANRRLRGSIDVYDRLHDDLLIVQTLPLETGYESIVANAGSMRNKGIELMLTTTNVQTDLITWETTFTFSKNVNTVESIYGQDEQDDVGNNLFIGESINAYYNYEFDGVWQADEAELAELYNQAEGQARVKDLNNDGVIDPDDDRKILGSSNPDWTGGLISRLTVGGFDFNFTLSTVQGVLAYSRFHENFENVGDRGRQKLDIDFYVPENNVGLTPRPSTSYPQARNEGTYWNQSGAGVGYYKDASFVKVNNISLGYSLPSSALERLKLQQLRIYVNVLNPFTFTDYTGFDPEWATASFSTGGVSNVITQLGLNLKF
ncbi:SusC/RagA family TonB-linked outer membrane protein [Reichenbachiella sp. 5M10]|uniref:SusC/RagA family TonB-linked outer membrane protein n=1 Tax=Reichenbachiella sp. 5M10 TaxID=1889772 RepID=UPI000C158713|nr:TonB-dependent receptor [Reichenbachiella sp. 5M10]PIB34677.1 SusC/RagA family TonB-linked outer membrane protein [Reichenbachiella sp. 5M10]